MEKLNLVKNRVSKLPPGFCFQPTDKELVFHYLKCKIFSYQLPASIIPEINVCKYDPWDLPGNCGEQDKYFFSSKETKYRNSNRMNRTTNSGYWKATGSDKKVSISSSISNGIAGIRKSLVFYQGKSPNGSRTHWIMHEYRLISVETTAYNQNYGNEIGDWVLCHIFMKKGSNIENSYMLKSNIVMNSNVEVAQPRFFDFMRVHNSAPDPTTHFSTSSSCSSSSEVSSSEERCNYIYADF
uniref:NAC family transcription factor n=1 Tax=Melilotus albus TaxID=47082 RepID=A0A896WDL2_MELAB|nr:NAC family transcription factor [Melilotus albus]